MKFINKLFVVLLLLGMIGACENLEFGEKQLVDPNNPTPETADLESLYNNIQLSFNDAFQSAEFEPGAAARMYHSTAFTYRQSAPNTQFNALWGNAYNVLFPDVQALIDKADGLDLAIHTGSAKVMQAYTLIMLVDILGDVPLSQALDGIATVSPAADPAATVYQAAGALLDEAIAEMTGTSAPAPSSDIFYNGNAANWVTAAKTIKFKVALNTGDVATINSLISGGDLISTASEDFQFNYGGSRNNPDSRHPNYPDAYEAADANYQSNYLMWLLRADKLDAGGNIIVDPRIRYYFYRQVDDAVNQDLNTFSCHLSGNPDQSFKPAYYDAVDPRLPYCIAYPDGYSGRDHLNGEGTPPDGPIKTVWGVYPSGGDFDDSSYEFTQKSGTTGGLGQGISPLMLSSYVDLMTAEAVLSLGATGDARTSLQNGIQKSLDKVESFESLVAGKMGTDVPLKNGDPSGNTVSEVFGMSKCVEVDDNGTPTDTSDDVCLKIERDKYVEEVMALYDNADAAGKLDIVSKELLIATFGNGIEAYNMYRRTGLPSNMQPAIGGAAGAFPLSFFYPANSVDRNANITQKGDLNVSVFWQNASVASELY